MLSETQQTQDMQKQQISTTYTQSGLMYIRTRCRNTIFFMQWWVLKRTSLRTPKKRWSSGFGHKWSRWLGSSHKWENWSLRVITTQLELTLKKKKMEHSNKSSITILNFKKRCNIEMLQAVKTNEQTPKGVVKKAHQIANSPQAVQKPLY